MDVQKFDKNVTKMRGELEMIRNQGIISMAGENNVEWPLLQSSFEEWNSIVNDHLTTPELDISLETSYSDNGGKEIDNNDIVRKLKLDLKRSEKARKHLSEEVDKIVEGSQRTLNYYQDTVSSMDKTIKENELSLMKLEEAFSKLKKESLNLLIEKQLLRSALHELYGINESELMNEASMPEKKIKDLEEQVENLQLIKNNFKEKERLLKNEINILNDKLSTAQQQKAEALTIFENLASYFAEKNNALRQEFKKKEEYWLNHPSDSTLLKVLKALQDENAHLKNINEEATKLNLAKDHRLRLFQRNCDDKKIENWLLNMNLGRKIKVAEAEASLLRRKLMSAEMDSKIYPYEPPNWPSLNSTIPSPLMYTAPLRFAHPNSFYHISRREPFAARQYSPIPWNYIPEAPLNISHFGNEQEKYRARSDRTATAESKSNRPATHSSISNPEIFPNFGILNAKHNRSEDQIKRFPQKPGNNPSGHITIG